MQNIVFLFIIIVLGASCDSSIPTGEAPEASSGSVTYSVAEMVPQKLQWHENAGYCGETSFQTIGLGLGQYIPQYELRSIAANVYGAKNNTLAPLQSDPNSQLLIGVNDKDTADTIGLTHSRNWTNPGMSKQFLRWVKSQLSLGHPVVIGVLLNKKLFYNDQSSLEKCTFEPGGKSTSCSTKGENCVPTAEPYAFDSQTGDYSEQAGSCQFGDKEYDHIVTVISVKSQTPSSTPGKCEYNENDIITIDDHGLFSSECDYGNKDIHCASENPINLCTDSTVSKYKYNYSYRFKDFLKTREEANSSEDVYSLNRSSTNYGIALTGLSGTENIPVQISIERQFECSAIQEGSSVKPLLLNPVNPDTALTLDVQVNGNSNGNYTVYRYRTVTDAQNKNHNAPTQSYNCTISNGINCKISPIVIDPGETAIFRAVNNSPKTRTAERKVLSS